MAVVNDAVSGNVATLSSNLSHMPESSNPIINKAIDGVNELIDLKNNFENRGFSFEPYGNTYRGIGASWFNKGDVAYEDWMRDQQARMNDHVLNKEILDIGNQFTAAENQKQRDFEKELASTSYQRAVEDLKRAGLNPVLAYSNGGADSPAFGVSTQSSTPISRSGYSDSGNSSSEASLLKTLVDIIGIFYGKGLKPKKTRAIGFRMD